MISVLFVCLGNICRSPMAEAVFRHYVKEEGLQDKIHIDSAGTGDWHVGNIPHVGTRTKLDQAGITHVGMEARQVAPSDFTYFNFIIAMDNSNFKNLTRLCGRPCPHLYRFVDFLPGTSYEEIPDPYFTGDFDETYDLVASGCHELLNKIKTQYRHQLV
jgi:protein-tyrosine phosphatase